MGGGGGITAYSMDGDVWILQTNLLGLVITRPGESTKRLHTRTLCNRVLHSIVYPLYEYDITWQRSGTYQKGNVPFVVWSKNKTCPLAAFVLWPFAL